MKKKKSRHKQLAIVPLATGLIVVSVASIGIDVDKAFAATSQIPELTSYQNGNAVKLEWSTDILDSSVLFSSGFEDGQTIPGFWWSTTDWNTGVTTNTEGNQKITTVDKRSGLKSYNVANTSILGNYSGRSIAGWGRFYYPNGTPLSITFYAKTDNSASIFPLGDGGWGKNFYNIQGVSVAQSAPAGQNRIKLNTVSGISPGGQFITSDTDINTVKDMYLITAVDSATNTVTLNYNLTRTMNVGEQLKSRYWKNAWSFESRSLTSADGWKRFSINTFVANNADYDVSQSGGTLYFINEAIGNLYIDDVKFGYATQAVVYRDGSQIYSGYLSDFNDTAATDKANPNAVTNVTASMSGNKPVISWAGSTDNGTDYNYTIKGVSQSGESPVSNPNSVRVTTGIKGYSVVVDQNPGTIPDNVIETTSASFTNPSVVNNNFYVHVVAVDNAGNVSAPVHMSYTDTIAPTLNLSASTTNPTNQDVILTASGSDNETGVKRIQKPDGVWVTGATTTYNATANGTFTFVVEDNAGNQTVKSITVTNIDKTAPSISLSSSTTSPTNQDVTVTATVTDGGSGIAVRKYASGNQVASFFATGGTTLSGNTFSVSTNGTYTVYAKDVAGNETNQTIVVSNIDKTAPSMSLTPNTSSPTNQDVTVTATIPDGDVVLKKWISGSQAASYFASAGTTFSGNSFKVSANGTYTVYLKDSAGNETVQTIVVSNIDKVAPVDATFIPDKTAITNTDVQVEVTYPNDAAKKEYRISSVNLLPSLRSGLWIIHPNVSITDDYAMTLNGTATSQATYLNVPISSNKKYTASIGSTTNIVRIWEYKGATYNNVSHTLTAESPINVITPKSDTTILRYEIINDKVGVFTYENMQLQEGDVFTGFEQKYQGVWTDYVNPITATKNALVEARSYDDAGNGSNVMTYNVNNIDKVAPLSATLTPDKTSPTNTEVAVTVTFPGDGAVKEVRINGGAWTAYTAPIVFSTNGKVEARSTDIAGNTSLVTSYDVTNIDKVVPIDATFSTDKTSPINQNVTVTITYPVDVAVKEVRVNGGSWTTYTAAVVFTANGTIDARSIDDAGNVSNVTTYTIGNIDKDAPTVPTLDADKTLPTNKDVVVTITFPADASVKEVRVNKGSWTTYSGSVTMTANGVVEARATDSAGNVSALGSLTVSNIDKVAPTTPAVSIDGNNIRVSGGTDGESGTKETLIKINDGEWVKYTGEMKLPDGQYTVYIKTVDEAGNESSVVSKEFLAYDESLNRATLAVEHAESSKTQEKADEAKALINLLPSGDSKEELIKRLIQVQGKIDENNIQQRFDSIMSVLSSGNVSLIMLDEFIDQMDELLEKVNSLPSGFDKASIEGKLIQLQDEAKLSQDVLNLTESSSIDDVENLAGLVNSLPDGALKDQLKVRLDAVDVIKSATEIVESLEGTLSKEDLAYAKLVVNNLSNSSEKTELLDRIQNAENKIFAQDTISKVENTLSKSDYEKAVLALDKLPEGELKESLKHHLDDAKKKIDATILVENSEKTKVQSDVNEARKAVSNLPDGQFKDDLNFRLDRYDTDLKNANSKVKTAETFMTVSSIEDAKTAVEKLLDSAYKDELKFRISVLETKFAQKSLQDQIAKATAKVVQAEQYKRDPYIGEAYNLTSDLPDGDIKDALYARLDALGLLNSSTLDKELLAKINFIQDAKKRSILLDVLRSIQRAEKYFSKGNIVYALRKVDNIPTMYRQDTDSMVVVTELTDRASRLKIKFNSYLEVKQRQTAIDKATQYVQMYEKYKLETYRKAAQQAVDELPAGDVKASLEARVNAVVK